MLNVTECNLIVQCKHDRETAVFWNTKPDLTKKKLQLEKSCFCFATGLSFFVFFTFTLKQCYKLCQYCKPKGARLNPSTTQTQAILSLIGNWQRFFNSFSCGLWQQEQAFEFCLIHKKHYTETNLHLSISASRYCNHGRYISTRVLQSGVRNKQPA